jgi:integrase
MPYRTSAGSTLRIDRIFKRVGRIAVSSGCRTQAEFDKRDAMLSFLDDRGMYDLLGALKQGKTTIADLYDAHGHGTLKALQADLAGDGHILRRPLWPAVDEWVPKSAAAPATRARYEVSLGALRRSAVLAETATVADLGTVDWRALDMSWGHSAADWNNMRRSVSAFLTAILDTEELPGVHHPFRVKMFGKRNKKFRFPIRREIERVPDISLPLFQAIVAKAPEFVRPAFITLAATGLRVGEYLRLTDTDLLPHTCAIRVPGSKTAGSSATIPVDPALWPWVTAAVPAPVGYAWLRKYWKRALLAAEADVTLRLHDLRHCTGQWLTDAGRPEASVQKSLRHASAAMTRRYTMQTDKGKDASAMASILAPHFTTHSDAPSRIAQPA